MNKYILSLSCPDRSGIVRAISTLLADHDMNIVESQQFGDSETGRFFMRIGFEGHGDIGALETLMGQPAAEFDMQWEIFDAAHRPRVLILLSKFDHCLIDLIYRQQVGSLKMDII